jgi:hypothetical protein
LKELVPTDRKPVVGGEQIATRGLEGRRMYKTETTQAGVLIAALVKGRVR